MIRIYKAIRINTLIEQTFEYVTTPGNQLVRVAPFILSVGGATEHSLEPGEKVTEEYLAACRGERVMWTVRERIAPSRWVIEGEVEGGGGGAITSTLTYHAAGSTTFERKLVYSMLNPPLALIDLLVLRRRAAAELAEALRRLEYGLEGSAA